MTVTAHAARRVVAVRHGETAWSVSGQHTGTTDIPLTDDGRRLAARARAVDGDIALFAHGHVLRVLVARWLGLPPGAGQHFLLDTGTLNVLSYYRGLPAVKTWNAPAFVGGDGAGRSTGGVA